MYNVFNIIIITLYIYTYNVHGHNEIDKIYHHKDHHIHTSAHWLDLAPISIAIAGNLFPFFLNSTENHR